LLYIALLGGGWNVRGVAARERTCRAAKVCIFRNCCLEWAALAIILKHGADARGPCVLVVAPRSGRNAACAAWVEMTRQG